jgi:arylsulfatase A-like enzyme
MLRIDSDERQGLLRLRALFGVVAFVFLIGCANEDSADTKPNVILIVIDTARADHFSAYGYDRPTTPNIDALARDSVRFSNAHSVSPWTLPSHMSMFTGRLPGQHGATWEAFSKPAETPMRDMMARGFQPGNPEQMLGSRLKASGYQTWGFSSNAWVSPHMGFGSGFD